MKNLPIILAIIIGASIIASSYIIQNLIGIGSELQNVNNQLQTCRNEVTNLNNQNTNLNNQLQDANNQLQTCRNELNQFKSSPSYYYSLRMNPKDTTIKQQAINAITQFENSPDCFEYGTYQRCNAYGIFGNCISTSEITYCQRENYAKKYYYSLDNLDVGLSTGMEHYYARAIIANYYWVRDNIHYVLGASGTGTQSDLQTLQLKAGKCDEQAVLLASLLRSVGVDAYPVLASEIGHAFTVARFSGFTKDKMPGAIVTINNQDYFLMDTVCSSCEIGSLPNMDYGVGVEILKFYDINK